MGTIAGKQSRPKIQRRPLSRPVHRHVYNIAQAKQTHQAQQIHTILNSVTVPQAKLEVGPTNDKYEQEADAVAEKVVAGQTAPMISRLPASGLDTSAQRQSNEEQEESVQTLQRQTDVEEEQEEEDESVQTLTIQRQAGTEDEAEESVQTLAIQRQADTEDEAEESVQTLAIQRQADTEEEAEESAQTLAIQRQAGTEEEAEDTLQTDSSQTRRSPSMAASVAEAIRNKGSGVPLNTQTRSTLESSMGADFSGVRVHEDSAAHSAARALNARAFTHGSDIWLGQGASQSNLQLMAHEATHVIQQNAVSVRANSDPVQSKPHNNHDSPDLLQRKTTAGGSANNTPAKTTGEAKEDIAPGIIDLQGKATFDEVDENISNWLEEQEKDRGFVKVKFGNIASGTIKIRKRKRGYTILKKQSISFNHVLFRRLGEVAPDLKPRLFIQTTKSYAIVGHVGLSKNNKYVEVNALRKQLIANKELLGLTGFDLTNVPAIPFRLKGGHLILGPVKIGIAFGRVVKGSVEIEASEEKINKFKANVTVNVKGMASGDMEMELDEAGLLVGELSLEVKLTDNLSGSVLLIWNGEILTGEGDIKYQGEKLSGSVKLFAMEKEEAKEREKKEKAPAEEAANSANEAKKKKKNKNIEYVLFGFGDLSFAFTDWLNGTAHVVVDPRGHVTIIGDIIPQKEYTLFEQTDLAEKLPKIPKFEARAIYGIPVVGNIFVAASIELSPFAIIGPGTLKDIRVGGTYSTDPQKNKDFSIQASLNISAAAGLDLTGNGEVGVRIAKHDIKAGASITATAGVKGYVEATPIIGYREEGVKTEKGEDKQGEFYIRGDLEIAAQPFLGLRGELYVELDSPWWSPAPDKRWPWPLGEKEWPLGDSIGIGASMDYVFGSGKAPDINFKPVEFSADKFMSDLIHDKAKAKSGGAAKQKKGEWKEKNSQSAEPPAKTKGAEAAAAKSAVKPTGASAGKKKTAAPVASSTRTAEGKSIEEMKREAAKKGRKPDTLEAKNAPPGKEASMKDKSKIKHDEDLRKGLAALEAVTQRYAKDGATKEELISGVKSVRRKFKVFKSITVVDGGETWDYEYVANPGKQTGPKKAKDSESIEGWPTGTRDDPIPIKWFKHKNDFALIGGNNLKDGIKLPAIVRRNERPMKVTDTNLEKMNGRTLMTRNGRPSANKKEQIREHLKALYDLPKSDIRRILVRKGGKLLKPGEYQIDHVRDFNWYGRDTYSNLWPTDADTNRAFNANNFQKARARVKEGNTWKLKTYSANHWGKQGKYLWIAARVEAPSTSANPAGGDNPINDGKHGIDKKKP